MSEYKRQYFPIQNRDIAFNSSRNFEFRYTCPDQLDRAIKKYHDQRAAELNANAPPVSKTCNNGMPKFCKIKHGGTDVTDMYKSHDQDVETVISRQLQTVNMRALSTDEVQLLIDKSNIKETKQTSESMTECTPSTSAAASMSAASKVSDANLITELSEIEAMHREVCEELERVKSSKLDIAIRTSNEDGSIKSAVSSSVATCGSSIKHSDTSLMPNCEYLMVSYEDYPQPQAKWVEVVHSAELSQQINVELCKPMDESLTCEASDSVAYEFMTSHADCYQGGDRVMSPGYDGRSEIERSAGSDAYYYADDSDLEYEMTARPNYAKYCQPKPERFVEAFDGDSESHLFVEMEKMPVMNLSFLKNMAPMRYSEMTEKLSEDETKQLKYGVQHMDVHDQIHVIEPMQKLAIKKSNKKRALQRKKKDQFPTSGMETKTNSEQMIHHKAASKQMSVAESASTERSANKAHTLKKMQRSSKQLKAAANVSSKTSAYQQHKPSTSANAQMAYSLPTTRMPAASQSSKKLNTRQKINAARPVSQQTAQQASASSRGDLALMKSNGLNRLDAAISKSARMKSVPTSRQSAGKEAARKSKAAKSLLCTKSIEDLKMEKLSIYNKMAITQERIIQALDQLRCSLLQIQIPNCNYEKSKRQRNAFEFCVRFSRNFLYPLKGMIDDFRFMSPDAFHSAISNDACYRVSAIYSLIYQSLHTYQRQLRYFLLDQVPQKLGALIEMIYTMTTICLEKGLFDRQDTIIECMQERCSKFLGFIEDMQEERFMQEREHVRRQTEKQNKLNPSHSHYNLKMCMNDLNMYEPKLVPKSQPPKPKRFLRKLRKTTAQQQAAQAAQMLDSEPESVMPAEEVKTHIEDFHDAISQSTLAPQRYCLRERHDLKKSVRSSLTETNFDCELPTTSYAAAAAAAATAVAQQYQAKNEETEDGLNPLNTALIEALQMVTKQQVRQVLEPIIQSLGSMLDKRQSDKLIQRVLRSLDVQQAASSAVDEAQNSKLLQNDSDDDNDVEWKDEEDECCSEALRAVIIKDQQQNDKASKQQQIQRKQQQTLNESAKPTLTTTTTTTTATIATSTTTTASCELESQRNSEGASKALRSTTETETSKQPALKRATRKKSNTAFAETALAALTAQLTSTRLAATSTTTATAMTATTATVEEDNNNNISRVKQKKSSRSLVEASTEVADMKSARTRKEQRQQQQQQQQKQQYAGGKKAAVADSFKYDHHDRYDSAVIAAADLVNKIVVAAIDCINRQGSYADNGQSAASVKCVGKRIGVEGMAKNSSNNNSNENNNSGLAKRGSMQAANERAKDELLTEDKSGANDVWSNNSNMSILNLDFIHDDVLYNDGGGSGLVNTISDYSPKRRNDKRAMALLEQSLRESKYELPLATKPNFSEIYGANNNMRPTSRKFTGVASVYSRQGLIEQSRKLQTQRKNVPSHVQLARAAPDKATKRPSIARPPITPRTTKTAVMRFKQTHDPKTSLDLLLVSKPKKLRKNEARSMRFSCVGSGISLYHHDCCRESARPLNRWSQVSKTTQETSKEIFKHSAMSLVGNRRTSLNRWRGVGGVKLLPLMEQSNDFEDFDNGNGDSCSVGVSDGGGKSCEIPLTSPCNTLAKDHLAILIAALNKANGGKIVKARQEKCERAGSGGIVKAGDDTTLAQLNDNSRLQLTLATSPYNDATLTAKYKQLQQQGKHNSERGGGNDKNASQAQIMLEELEKKILKTDEALQKQQSRRQRTNDVQEMLKMNESPLHQWQDEEEEQQEMRKMSFEQLQPMRDEGASIGKQNLRQQQLQQQKKLQQQQQQKLHQQQQYQQQLQQQQSQCRSNKQQQQQPQQQEHHWIQKNQPRLSNRIEELNNNGGWPKEDEEQKRRKQPAKMAQNLSQQKLSQQQQQQKNAEKDNKTLKAAKTNQAERQASQREKYAKQAVIEVDSERQGDNLPNVANDHNAKKESIENLSFLIEKREQYRNTCESNFFYNNPTYSKPWAIFASFADKLANDVAKEVEKNFTNAVSKYVDDFLKAEMKMT